MKQPPPASPKRSAQAGAPFPALAAWRAELTRGERTVTTFDPLFRAACAEMYVLEMQTAVPEIALSYRRRAIGILQDAARAQRAGRRSA